MKLVFSLISKADSALNCVEQEQIVTFGKMSRFHFVTEVRFYAIDGVFYNTIAHILRTKIIMYSLFFIMINPLLGFANFQHKIQITRNQLKFI